MRDPLRNVSVRFKLALTFLGVCLLAFGVGGTLVAVSAEDSLEAEILARLEFQSEAHADALDATLEALAQRTRDFASDGYIRTRLERVVDSEPGERDRAASELRAHLRANKLPLVAAFTNLALVGGDAEPLVVADPAGTGWARAAAAGLPAEDEYSGLLEPVEPGGIPSLALSTPVRSLDGSRRLGTLLVQVHPGVWVVDALQEIRAGKGAPVRPTLSLIDASGRALQIPAALTALPPPRVDGDLVQSGFGLKVVRARPEERDDYSPVRGVLRRRIPLTASGWAVEMELESKAALAAVSGLRTRFVIVGLVLSAVASVLLLFPMRFLARPLRLLREAARRVEGGEFSVRVEVESTDEIGDLARSFNRMAQAVEERTSKLASTADDLEQRSHELRAERDRLNAVLSSMRDGLVVLDADGVPIVRNAASGPLIQMLEDGRYAPTSHRLCVDETEREAAGHGCRQCLFDPSEAPRSCVIDLGPRVYEIHGTPLAPGTDGRKGRVLVSRDVTDRIARDEQEIHQERLSVLGEVAAVVAHEINNPLAAITMFNQMLGTSLEPDSPLQENVEVIERNAAACKQTIRELLDYATGAAPEVGPVDVHATLEDVARFLRTLQERRRVELELELTAEDFVVDADEVQLRQVFVNLVMNALQAVGSDGGRVVLRTSSAGGHLEVDVEDDGPGVPADIADRVFDPFFTTKPRGTGTGLGLPTARRIAEMQGGGLDLIESAPGRTVFRVRMLTRNAVAQDR